MLKKILSIIIAAVIVMGMIPAALADDPVSPEEMSIVNSDELTGLIEDFIAANKLKADGISVGLIYTATGDSYYYNADKFMYSASLYKVGNAMLLSEKIADGSITEDTLINGNTVEYLESTSVVYSNNDTGHAIVDYLGGTYNGKCSDKLIKYTDLQEDYFQKDFYEYSYYTARFFTQLLNTLYKSPDSYPHVIDYMKQSSPEAAFNLRRVAPDGTEVAQKYGSLKSFSHSAGIFFRDNPVIITVMTDSYEGGYRSYIIPIAKIVLDYCDTLDADLADYNIKLEQARAEAERQAELDAQEAERAAEEAAARAEAEQNEQQIQNQENSKPSVSASGSADSAEKSQGTLRKIISILVKVLIVLIVITVLVVAVSLMRKHLAKTYEVDEDEYEPVGSVMSRLRGITRQDRTEDLSDDDFYDDDASAEEEDADDDIKVYSVSADEMLSDDEEPEEEEDGGFRKFSLKAPVLRREKTGPGQVMRNTSVAEEFDETDEEEEDSAANYAAIFRNSRAAASSKAKKSEKKTYRRFEIPGRYTPKH